MPDAAPFWHGEDWQNHCLALLSLRYKHEFQAVPDENSGDYGIEAFCRDDSAYQCYSPDEPLSNKERYEKHRDKITQDLKKLVKNDLAISKMMAPNKIRRWIFLVPIADNKELLLHASTKSDEIRLAALSCAADDFQVVVETHAQYALEHDQLTVQGLSKVAFEPTEPTASDFCSLETTENDSVNRLDKKLMKHPGVKTAAARANLKRSLLLKYMQGNQLVETLRAHWPAAREKALRIKQQREWALPIELAEAANDGKILTNLVRVLKADYAAEVPSLRPAQVELLAFATVTEWLLRCPLYFGSGEE